MKVFTQFPAKVIVEGTGDDEGITWIGYSPLPFAKLADAVWIVQRIDATGSITYPTASATGGGTEILANQAMTNPGALTYYARS
jgi:hypothetical protein